MDKKNCKSLYEDIMKEVSTIIEETVEQYANKPKYSLA